ncbi:hypothetical protein CEY16_07570 [Halalkalibacillus sediminis]|uniref:SH3b domain-containing protein n=1 Tax=Halalkalibacillus sediminis TaxID=2018042 RepID=A0A2I0QTW1_9BACI|nr:SH3 domain-containing protein [Halalkalibacillus sediminis]PKR77781.1 hypothetical protein CEY16_07570 [Halalkalibacillus sediminis]
MNKFSRVSVTMCVAFLFTLLSTIMIVMPTAADTENYQGIASKDKTNVYEDTSRNSSVLKDYEEGTILKYESHSSDWYKATVIINNNRVTGYINKSDVENANAESESLEGVALQSTTSVFSRASTNSNALKSYDKGTILKYETFSSDWYKATVILNNKARTGYIHKSHVENATQEPSDYEGVALKTSTKVFSEASKESRPLKSYDSGSVLKFQSYTSGWYKATVILNNKPRTGYISKNDVDRLLKSPTKLEGVAKKRTSVFAQPNESSNALKSYSGGTILKYETYSNSWHKAIVYLNGKPRTGYLPVNAVDDLVSEPESLRGIAVNGKTSTYESPSLDSNKVKTYSEGTVLIYKSLSTNWNEAINIVNGKSKKVYIHRDQVENAFKEQKSLNGISLKQPTNAYPRASRNSKALKTYDKGSALRIKTFSESWYEADVITGGKKRKAYFHHDDINTDILYQTTNYDITFNNMVDIQMTRTPKANGSGTISATREQVEYYSNPSNFERGTDEYLQFLVLSQPTGVNANELNQKILANKGTLDSTGSAFIQGAKDYGVNELYLIAHAVHETGNGTSKLAQGVEYKGKTVYNMYGIHAFDSCPLSCGSEKAYNEGWFTPQQAIIGGAKFIGQNWIHRGQDTLYKMRWNPDNPGVHQYATHVRWAELQTDLIADYYKILNDYVQIYDVPKYASQPDGGSEPSQPSSGSGDSSSESDTLQTEYPKNTFGVTNTDGNLNIRSETNTTKDPIGKIPNGSNISIIGDNGGSWLKIVYDGTEGWVHGNYVEIMNLLEVDVDPTLTVRNAPAGEKTGEKLSDGDLVVAELDSDNNFITEKAELSGTEYTWYKIQYKNETVWVAGEFVNIVK